MVKLKELKPLGIAVNTGADGEATSVEEIMEAVFIDATAGIGGGGAATALLS